MDKYFTVITWPTRDLLIWTHHAITRLQICKWQRNLPHSNGSVRNALGAHLSYPWTKKQKASYKTPKIFYQTQSLPPHLCCNLYTENISTTSYFMLTTNHVRWVGGLIEGNTIIPVSQMRELRHTRLQSPG